MTEIHDDILTIPCEDNAFAQFKYLEDGKLDGILIELKSASGAEMDIVLPGSPMCEIHAWLGAMIDKHDTKNADNQ
jgi:hypothetical protein